eukprot:233693-Pleurochrysis_carterae.AAC.4
MSPTLVYAALNPQGQVVLKCLKKSPMLMDAARALQWSIRLQHGPAECLAAARSSEAAKPAADASNTVAVDAFAYMSAQSISERRAEAACQTAEEADSAAGRADAERDELSSVIQASTCRVIAVIKLVPTTDTFTSADFLSSS